MGVALARLSWRPHGEIIAGHELDDTRDYQPKKRQETLPEGRASVNDAPRHL
jgi:hypothetical protein